MTEAEQWHACADRQTARINHLEHQLAEQAKALEQWKKKWTVEHYALGICLDERNTARKQAEALRKIINK